MKALIVYDSHFGNTQKVAESISEAFSKKHSVKNLKIESVKFSDLDNINLLIIGSPTYGGRPTESINKFINNIPSKTLKSLKIASFDTRLSKEKVNFALKILMKVIDYAAPKIAQVLIQKGAIQVLPPQGFLVKDKKGPLLEGELEKAKSWVQEIEMKLINS